MSARIAVLLLQMGGPRSLGEVEEYIRVLFSDADLVRLPAPVSWFRAPLARLVAKRRAPAVRRQYQHIGGASPNNRITEEQADALQRALHARGFDQVLCFAAMTYTPPSAGDALRSARAAGCTQFLAVSLFPHYCSASTGASISDLHRGCEANELAFEDLWLLDRWSDDCAYLDAMAQRCRTTLAEAATAHPDPPHLVISAHGIPESYVQRGDPYLDEIRACVENLIKRLRPAPAYSLCFQSRATPVKWVQPATDATLQRLGAEGVRNVVVLPISFVNDHIETLYEIDMLLSDVARACGVDCYRRVPSFNADADLIGILAGLVAGSPLFHGVSGSAPPNHE